MIALPRGKSVKEGIDPKGIDWQEVLGKLHDGHFTGYLHVTAAVGSGILLFFRGQVATIRYCSGSTEQSGEEALLSIFSDSLSGQARLNIYRLEPGLAVDMYNLIEGNPLYQGQRRELLDIPHLIALLKRDAFSGGLHVQAKEAVAIILMREGRFLGFFHDGSPTLATDAELSRSVAWQPEATIDVIRSAGVAEEDLPDLLAKTDLVTLWDKALLSAAHVDL
ncbi:PATAN domain protein [Syntrophotalea carbinolica DSM 2380]|uniref:PATAN domain protein n=1 Tax=Syntrophotalea carbinolica (strain DSM 2380 / NBRC 103641 / GraBd1) TaxID=338963 RepID=Q3A2X9_SYNC1|nr:DUF4388 domain-containing protein [Syntrophotalea carbinolica]ABA89278.1 PATAN domain protein [Syntrophotalea carbinolica DSM 2380]